ncbi:MAG: hypothetical protein A3E78_09995 [Alphaproteobacteria bacterium RIFCSPHIGHO2_12_FULL_63_12]|nr:MAG: hypothetical protein A3E78_09995 [Alphaproteobacteria bacterium RIFCSPHIGHO2_12_FULL_63_12]
MTEETKKQAGAVAADAGRGLGLISLLVGLATGGAVYWIADRWIDASTPTPLSITTLQTIVAFAAGWLLLSERRDFLRPILPSALIAAILAGPTWRMMSVVASRQFELEEFPVLFWFFLSAPLSYYLMLSLAKASLETGFPPKYASHYFHGLTLPLIAGGAKLFAGLSLILLFAWAALLKQMDVRFFSELFDEPWFIFPFLGAIVGLSIAMIRAQQAVLGALRFILLLFSRIAMPIMALFSVTFMIVLALKGPGAILDAEFFFGRPGAAILFLAFAGMLIFNGVYQNDEGGPPPVWLRLSTIIAIALFPVYTGLAAYGLWSRIDEYGLTPPRIVGIAMTFLAFAYSLVLIAGLLTELNWRGAKWMPLVAPLNTLMSVAWIVVLLGLSSPFFNTWAISARSQEQLLLSGDVDAGKFDFGYMRFKLGRDGDAALTRIEKAGDHPQIDTIRAEIARARAALTYWEYKNPSLSDSAPETPAPPVDVSGAEAQPGPMDLDLNPQDAPADGTDS